MPQEDSIVALADEIMGGFLSAPTVHKANVGSTTGSMPVEDEEGMELVEISNSDRDRLLEHATGVTQTQVPVKAAPAPITPVETQGFALTEAQADVLRAAAAIMTEMATSCGAIGSNTAGATTVVITPGDKEISKGVKKASKPKTVKGKKEKEGEEVDDLPFEKRTKVSVGQGRTKTGMKNMKHPVRKENKSFDDFVSSVITEYSS
tara:strand:- start:1031 stop:1648 length:618 start_codon:yes stop_codon:yes gene_type:complete